MSPTEAVELSKNERTTGHGHRVLRRWLIIASIAFVSLVSAYVIFLAVDWPFTEDAIVGVLQERFARSVTVDRFQRTYFPPGCIVEGIKFLHRKHKEKSPLITVRKLVIEGSYSGMLRVRKRIPFVRVVGLHVTVPPKLPNGEPNPVMPLTHGRPDSVSSVIVGTAIADEAILDFLPNPPGKKTFRLVIDKLRLDNIGNDKPISYRVRFSNTTPPGLIESSGVFGPWKPDNPGSTLAQGSYQYRDANLAVFSGISGTLSSTGTFKGTLARLNAIGTAEVPSFQVKDTSHIRRLTARFTAAVNATNGDTELDQVVAHFDRTTVMVQGAVASRNGESGKTASLDMFMQDGRIEDVLDLFISARQSPMTGSVGLRAHVFLPPSPDPFVQRLQMTGDFGVGSARFTNRETEQSISRLSESAEKKKAPPENPETVLSNLKGHGVLNGGTAKLSNLSFDVPGAAASMQGTYDLVNYQIDLRGILRTNGKPADATTGFKSFLLKALNPFFKKQGKAKLVPIKITGRYGHTNIGLDLRPGNRAATARERSYPGTK